MSVEGWLPQMLSRVIYVKGNELSEKCKNELVESLEKYNWEYEVVEGITPSTLNESDFPWDDLPNGRLESMKSHINPEEKRKYKTKKSCLFNNLKFAQDVIKRNESMIFLEHDVLVTSPIPSIEEPEYFCFLNIDGAFKKPNVLANYPELVKWYTDNNHKLGVQDFPSSYPLRYYKDNEWKGECMTPGLSGYILTVKGAKRLLKNVERYGLEQGDFTFNNKVIPMQYIYPSPLKFQNIKPNLSHKL